jgi:hypothetical protein
VSNFAQRIRPFVDHELREAELLRARGSVDDAFVHLERAHVLAQASTREHVRTHVHMLRWAIRCRKPREALGQFVRIVGAATKTSLGWVPEGNTGGSNVSPFKRLPIAADLAEKIDAARAG